MEHASKKCVISVRKLKVLYMIKDLRSVREVSKEASVSDTDVSVSDTGTYFIIEVPMLHNEGL